MRITLDEILEILNLLKNSPYSMEWIGKKFGFGRATIRKINLGQSFPIKGYNYPARITK